MLDFDSTVFVKLWSFKCLTSLTCMQLNAFSTQIADRIDSVTPTAREEIAAKLFKRLRNLM